jgi:hypothetical protein
MLKLQYGGKGATTFPPLVPAEFLASSVLDCRVYGYNVDREYSPGSAPNTVARDLVFPRGSRRFVLQSCDVELGKASR